jgi:hypothetical protein
VNPVAARRPPLPAAGALWLALAALPAGATTPDARLVAVHSAATPVEALAAAERLASDPAAAAAGIDYVRGHLLELTGKGPAAERAFTIAMQRAPQLAAYSRYRLARLQLRHHPEVAAGLLVPLLGADTPPALRHHAAALLRRALGAGGDCRLLERADLSALAPGDRRPLEVRRADCGPAGAARAADRLAALVAAEPNDEAGREAALRLVGLGPRRFTLDLAVVVARAFQHHRRPDLTIAFLGPFVSQLPERLREQREIEAIELLAFSQAAREQPELAAASFARLAVRVQRPDQRASAFYREGWARELAGDVATALNRYQRASGQTPASEVTPVALLAAFRLQWRAGDRAGADRTLEALRARPEWGEAAGRAALFAAVSQLARGEVGTAPELLQSAGTALGMPLEIAYWSGRSDELRRRSGAAVGHYLRVLREPYHPLAADARRRLASPALRTAASSLADTLRVSKRTSDRVDAWLLLPADDARREPLRLQLYQRFARDVELAPWLRLAAVEPARWPLWQATLATSEDRLLALGGWQDVGLDTILRHFPLAEPQLAFTAGQRLAGVGDLARAQLVGNELMRRLDGRIPLPLLPLPLRQLLLPRPWPQVVQAASRQHGIDGALLHAVMREGSGFDTEALPAGGGRGLMLLDHRHASRHASAAGLGQVRPEDLFEPRWAIPLAASRIGELARTFPNRPPLALAAYLTSAAEARAWGRWCDTDDPAEVLTKVGSDDVRAAMARVLATQAAYRELYGPG